MTAAVQVLAAVLGVACAWSSLLAGLYGRRHAHRVIAARTAGTLDYRAADLQLLANVQAGTIAVHLAVAGVLLALSAAIPAAIHLAHLL